MRLRSIERRLFEAAMLVLATGCYTSSPPPREPDDNFAKPPPGDERNIGELPPDPVDDPDQDANTNVTANPNPIGPKPGSPPNAQQLCADYKAKTKVKPPKGPARQSHYGGVGEAFYWDGNRNVAQCTIVRSSVDVTMQVTRTPTCCPAGMPPGAKCPPSYQTTAAGSRIVVENAELHADGTLAKSVVSSVEVEKHPEVRHNCGRRPEALALVGKAPATDVGGELAAMAELEAASVPAFDRLARELAAHGAPADLVERARSAMLDEIRHARAMTHLAAEHGATLREIRVGELPLRSLEAIACENAVEGCVREAYGALVATYQAERAAPELRAVFRAIARDEREHAALAEDVHAWVLEQLSPSSRATVIAAQSLARAELRAQLQAAPACETLGVPGGDTAVALFDAYFAS